MIRKFAIFDIDGTLHKTEVMSLRAYAAVMPRLGLPVPERETLLSTYGCTTDEILRRLKIAPADRERFLEYIEHEEVVQMHLAGECYDGVVDGLKRLYEDGVILGVCSMCGPPYMDAFLECFGLDSIVRFRRNESSGTDKALLLKQMLDECRPDVTVMAGDRSFDIDAAGRNGIASIGCLYGYAPEEAKSADVAVHDAKGMFAAVRQLLEMDRQAAEASGMQALMDGKRRINDEASGRSGRILD